MAPAPTLRTGSPLADLPGVGPARRRALHRLGLRSVSDLLRHLPHRYQREEAEGRIADLVPDTIGSARGTIMGCRWVAGRDYSRNKGRFEAILQDDSGRLQLAFFNARYLTNRLHPGQSIRVQGKVATYGGYLQMVNPKWEELDGAATSVAVPEQVQDPEPEPASPSQPPTDSAPRLRPVYPATEDLPSTFIESLIAAALPAVLPTLSDPLPADLLRHNEMPPLAEAFRLIHQPEHEEHVAAARRRLAYNELLLLQLGVVMKRDYVRRSLTAPALRHSDAVAVHIRERFPFPLTPSQEEVIAEIVGDLTATQPMNRLLQGDVGSGKTVVALYAMLLAVADRKQAALMAPTELLAEQHFASITRMLEGGSVRVALLTGGQSTAGSPQRKALLAQLAAGEIDLLIGTHALATDAVRFKNLAVAVVDEQHRFGVKQRAALRDDAGNRQSQGKESPDLELPADELLVASSEGESEPSQPATRQLATSNSTPHTLVMTATPIPRTLSLTVFGDLDVSTIRGLPPGRTPVVNRVMGQDRSDEVYQYVRTRIERGEQAYVVVPTIEGEGSQGEQLKSVKEHAKLLQDKYFQGYRVATLHGRLKREERERRMDRFRRGQINVLVATTVIEVGVDVPNATAMVVEHAERFGLAQLHQLRGRVGRGTSGVRPLCVFLAEPTTEEATRRMDAIASTNDGFRIAELDLEIRGMGEFFGTRQSGAPPLRVARIPDDLDLLRLARRDAETLIQTDPTLAQPEHETLRRVLLQQYGEALGLVDVA